MLRYRPPDDFIEDNETDKIIFKENFLKNLFCPNTDYCNKATELIVNVSVLIAGNFNIYSSHNVFVTSSILKTLVIFCQYSLAKFDSHGY